MIPTAPARLRLQFTNSAGSSLQSEFRQRRAFLSVVLNLSIIAIFFVGCGGTSSSPALPPPVPGNTAVTLLLSSTANDKFIDFNIHLDSLDLISESGATTHILTGSGPQNLEFIHLNGGVTPIAAVTVPQGTYTSAVLSLGGSSFSCVTVNPSGGLVYSTYAYGITSFSSVKLPSPINISGNTMALSLDLQVVQSAALSGCTAGASYTITPTFNLSAVKLASPALNFQNGKLSGLKTRATSVNTSNKSFTVVTDDGYAAGTQQAGTTLSFVTNSATTYQGVASFAALAAGMFMDVDSVIQSDGSLLATRIAVDDPTATNQVIGPLSTVYASEPALFITPRQLQGDDLQGNLAAYSFGSNTIFQSSGQFTNLASLPFSASFNASNMVGGQNVSVSSQTISSSGGFPYTVATAVTLMPQNINGTVTAVAASGNFQIYTVQLASYGLFRTLTAQAGLGYTLNNPDFVQVYVDSNTQILSGPTPLQVGSLLRFNGLVFNDNGNLRMDCGAVYDGVAE